MTNQPKSNPTEAQLTEMAAEIMGWVIKPPATAVWLDSEGYTAIDVKGFSPCTKIELALEILDAWNDGKLDNCIDLEYDPYTRRWSLGEYDGKRLVSKIKLKDLALKIMLTIWEVKNGKC